MMGQRSFVVIPAGARRWLPVRPGWSGSLAGAGAALAIVLAAAAAEAGSIGLSLTATPEFRQGNLQVALTVRNSGDEAARSVSPVLEFRGQTIRGERRPQLGPNQAFEAVLTHPAGNLGPGRWPYRIVVEYADANQYPFQALHVGTVELGSPPPAKVAVVRVSTPDLTTSGKLETRLKNLSDEARSVAIRIHVPEGIELAEPPAPVQLDPWEERTVAASLVNRSGLPGSVYAVFVSAEYEDEGVHQAAVVPATLRIVTGRTSLARFRLMLFGAAALLVLAWAVVVVWRRKRRPR